MIYLLSDLHGELYPELLEYAKGAGEGDLLILLGDVGLAFDKSEENRRFTEEFLSLGIKIAFIDGNHENFEYLASFPVEQWCGGRVHRLTPNIVHLMRGEAYEIEGKSFFVFGGCSSSPKWCEAGLWHEGDEPSKEELSRAYECLARHGYRFDYVLTHKYTRVAPRPFESRELEELLRFINERVELSHWYAGHAHVDEQIDEKHTRVYKKLISLK